MATVWDAARALLATAGTEQAATAAALELAALCRQFREFAEAHFWLATADAIAWECNPQPLIAPQLRADKRQATHDRHRAARQGLELPKHRSTVLRFRRDLQKLRDRYGPPDEARRNVVDEPEE